MISEINEHYFSNTDVFVYLKCRIPPFSKETELIFFFSLPLKNC